VCARRLVVPALAPPAKDPSTSCVLMFSTSPATTPRPIESCAPGALPARAGHARRAAGSRRGLLHARNGSGTRRGPLGSFLWGHAWRGGCRQPSGSEGIVGQGSTPLDHAQQSLIAGCDTAGCLPATAGCHEDADSGSRGDLPVDARRAERSRAIAQWCADRLTAPLTAPLTATLTAVLTDEIAGRFFRSTITQGRVCAHRQLTATLTATLTGTLTAPGQSPVSRRARVGATPGGGAAPVVVDGQAHATIPVRRAMGESP
jgi:hypothetical protein